MNKPAARPKGQQANAFERGLALRASGVSELLALWRRHADLITRLGVIVRWYDGSCVVPAAIDNANDLQLGRRSPVRVEARRRICRMDDGQRIFHLSRVQSDTVRERVSVRLTTVSPPVALLEVERCNGSVSVELAVLGVVAPSTHHGWLAIERDPEAWLERQAVESPELARLRRWWRVALIRLDQDMESTTLRLTMEARISSDVARIQTRRLVSGVAGFAKALFSESGKVGNFARKL